jgi:hypothetical protein
VSAELMLASACVAIGFLLSEISTLLGKMGEEKEIFT